MAEKKIQPKKATGTAAGAKKVATKSAKDSMRRKMSMKKGIVPGA